MYTAFEFLMSAFLAAVVTVGIIVVAGGILIIGSILMWVSIAHMINNAKKTDFRKSPSTYFVLAVAVFTVIFMIIGIAR